MGARRTLTESPETRAETAPAELTFPNSLTDWAARGFFFVVFLYVGAAKFTSPPDAPWFEFFREVGFGQWFRYFTGSLEIIAAFLVLIPQTVTAGIYLLMCITSGAVLVVILVLHKPSEAFVAFALLCALIALWMRRRRA
jgi:putative oxidoreductase